MKLITMTEFEAKDICKWEYEGEYSVYNYNGWDECKEEAWAITKKDSREKEFFSAYLNDEFIGYIRLNDVQTLSIIGIGLRPDLCGHGYGGSLLQLAILKSLELHPDKRIVLMVRPFNERAIRCYEKVGFVTINTNFICDDEDFYVMEYKGI